MDYMQIEAKPNDRGGIDYVIHGDTTAFYWMLTAAGNARDGFQNNLAETTDGSGDRLVLAPTHPNDVKRPSRMAQLQARQPIDTAGRPVREEAQLEIPREHVDEDLGKAVDLIAHRLELGDRRDEDLLIRIRARTDGDGKSLTRAEYDDPGAPAAGAPDVPPAPAPGREPIPPTAGHAAHAHLEGLRDRNDRPPGPPDPPPGAGDFNAHEAA